MAPTFVSRAGGRQAAARSPQRCVRRWAWRSTWRCPAFARPAANRSATPGFAPAAGRGCRSFPGPIANGSASRSRSTAGPGLLSMEAMADPPAYGRARAAVRYDDVAGTLVQAFKYGDRLDLAPMMGRWMATAGRDLFDGADALVPVPLHWRRQWARRFNQSALLAEVVASASTPAGLLHGPEAREGDAATGRPVAIPAFRQRPGCVPGARRGQARGDRPPPHPGRRRADVGRDRRHLRPGAAPGGRRERRCAGIRAGCGAYRAPPYKMRSSTSAESQPHPDGQSRNLHHAVLPLLRRRQTTSVRQRRDIHRDRCGPRSRASAP